MVSRTEKFRGSQTHGKGKKAGRGAGKRGGKGNAGLHKHRWIHCIKYMPDHFGSYGFKRPQKMVGSKITINISTLEKEMDHLVHSECAVKNGDVYEIDLTEMGIDKLLGTGKATKKMRITVESASARALEKVSGAGGEVLTSDEEISIDE